MEEKKALKHVIVQVTDEMHKQVKMRAADRRITIKLWIERAIAKQMEQEDRYK